MMIEIDNRCYSVNEFNGMQRVALNDKDVAINKKIALLQDHCLLAPNHKKKEQKVRTMLMSCTNEYHMTRLLHDVFRGDKSLNQLLEEKGLM